MYGTHHAAEKHLCVRQGAHVQAKKKWNEAGRIVGCTLRVLEPWFGNVPRRVFADSYFGSIACVFALRRHNLFSIMVIKGGSKHIPKKAMIAAVEPQRDARMYKTLKLTVCTAQLLMWALRARAHGGRRHACYCHVVHMTQHD
jgi:hypothetical protein